MITFSRLLLNPQKRGGRRLLTNPQAMHAAVRACFPPDLDDSEARVLWRVDEREHEHVLYVVGPEQPDLSIVVDQAGWFSRPGRSADYAPMLDGLRVGHERAFRLTANPVRSLPADGAKRGKVVPHVTAAQQQDWLVEKAPSWGFQVREVEVPGLEELRPDVLVDRRQDLSFSKGDRSERGRRPVSLRTASYEGTLRVTDIERFRRALTHGVGRARAYGCGLLTIARVQS